MNWNTPPPCSVADCERLDIKARGMCTNHYNQWFDAGKPNPQFFPRISEATNFLPNPWIKEAPPCPHCNSAEWVFLWKNEGTLRWFCQPCRRRFDVAEEAAA